MMPVATALAEMLAGWEADASALARRGDPRGADMLRQCIAEARAAIDQAGGELLSLGDAARASGYSTSHLRALIADGRLPSQGRKGAPRIRRADLPRRPGAGRASAPGGYDPIADAADMASLSHRLRKA